MILGLVLYLIIFLILLILTLILLPYTYRFNFDTEDNYHYKIIINTPLFKIIYRKAKRYSITFIRFLGLHKKIRKNDKSNQEEKEKINEIEKENSKKDTKIETKNGFPYKLITKENISHLLGFVIKIIKIIKPNSFKLNLLISSSDPYHNGLMLAYYHSLKGIYPHFPIKLKIDWQKEVIKAQGSVTGKIIPVVLLAQILYFIFTPRTIKILWQSYKHYK